MEKSLNIFHIPSWYPTDNDPIPGYFIKEQITLLAEQFERINHGISTWGQNDARYLLPANQFLTNIGKIRKSKNSILSLNKIRTNCIEYSKPCYTWTRKILKGNNEEIVIANIDNLRKFQSDYGKVDVIHAHVSYPAGYIAYKISQITGIPYIISEHMGPFPFESLRNKAGKAIIEIQIAMRNAKVLTAPSQFLAQQLNPYTNQTIQVLPNFIDFGQSDVKSLESNSFNICYLGRLVEAKGLKELLEALRLLKIKNWSCDIIGDGPMKVWIEDFIENYKLQDKVRLRGLITETTTKNQLISNSTLVILPSHLETFGIVLIEALACGKPVISTKCGGPEEIITKENGLLVEVGNPVELANAINYIYNNQDKYDSEQIRNVAKGNYDIGTVGRKLLALYKSVQDN